jgi:hypothetical protein
MEHSAIRIYSRWITFSRQYMNGVIVEEASRDSLTWSNWNPECCLRLLSPALSFILFICLTSILRIRGAPFFHAQAHIPTQPPQTCQEARIPQPHEDQERSGGSFASSRQGAQTRIREAWLSRVVFRSRPIPAGMVDFIEPGNSFQAGPVQP